MELRPRSACDPARLEDDRFAGEDSLYLPEDGGGGFRGVAEEQVRGKALSIDVEGDTQQAQKRRKSGARVGSATTSVDGVIHGAAAEERARREQRFASHREERVRAVSAARVRGVNRVEAPLERAGPRRTRGRVDARRLCVPCHDAGASTRHGLSPRVSKRFADRDEERPGLRAFPFATDGCNHATLTGLVALVLFVAPDANQRLRYWCGGARPGPVGRLGNCVSFGVPLLPNVRSLTSPIRCNRGAVYGRRTVAFFVPGSESPDSAVAASAARCSLLSSLAVDIANPSIFCISTRTVRSANRTRHSN